MSTYNGFDKISASGDSNDPHRYKVYTLDYVFKKLIDYGED